jgi:nucleoside-diphosphate-sugar epimerase
LLAIEKSIESRTSSDYNFGPVDAALNVGTVAEIACEAWGSNLVPQFEETKRDFHEAKHLDLSSEKAQKELNWQPCFDQREAIIETINWWKSSVATNANDACAQNIARVRNHYKF